MKILAIRGENICSLQKPFEIDFTREPLASAGLFAISGPTGAGKSTILDVICVALYHKAPRLEKAPTKDAFIDDGNEKIYFDDLRNLITKGAISGFAEVDFEGVNKKRYRARWKAGRRQPKRKPKKDGSTPLEVLEANLRSLPDQTLFPEKSTELRNLIENKIGLTFHQFTRTVLLAQNEFTNFLKASDKEKVEILKKLSGEDIFSKIGSKVFEICKSHQQTVQLLNAQIDSQVVLTSEQRIDKEKEAEKLRQQTGIYEQMIEILSREEEASKQLTDLSAQYSDLMTRQTHCQKDREELSLKLKDAEINLTSEQRRHQATQAELVKARELDTRLATLENDFGEIDKKCRMKTESVDTLTGQIKSYSEKARELSERLSAIASWREENHKLSHWSEQWAALSQGLSKAQSYLNDETQYKTAVKETETQLNELTKSLGQIEATKAALTEDLARHRSLMEPLAKKLEAFSVAQAEEKRSKAEKELFRLNKLAELKSMDLGDDDLLMKLSSQIKGFEEEAARRSLAMEASRIVLDTLDAEKLVQGRVRDSLALKVSQSVEALRAQLVEGEDCPVCGSKSHPYATHPAEKALASLLQEAESELSALESRIKSERNHHHELTLEYSEAKTSAEQLRSQHKNLEQTRSSRQVDQWARLSDGLSLADCDLNRLKEESVSYEKELLECSAHLASWSKDQLELKKMTDEAASVSLEISKLTADQQSFSLEKSKLDERREQKQLLLQKALFDLDAELLVLESILQLQDFRKKWQESPESFAREIERQVKVWLEKQSEAERLKAENLELQLHKTNAENNLKAAQSEWQSLKDDLDHRGHIISELKKERSEVLQGKKVEEIEKNLEDTLKSYADALESVRKKDVSSQLELSKIEEALNQIRSQIEKNKTDSEKRLTELQSESSKLGLSPELSEIEKLLESYRIKVKELEDVYMSLYGELRADQKMQNERAQLIAKQKDAADIHRKWDRLRDLIGCRDGAVFQNAAHQVTMDVLLAHANYHLESFAPRYRLLRQPSNHNLIVEDLDTGGNQRSVYSLSGGESFLVSLALAMGLSSLSSEKIHVESLFIDEGFGSLDAETLRLALRALDALQSQGRKVGVISHVADMAERIGVQIEVVREGRGRSRVVVPKVYGGEG